MVFILPSERLPNPSNLLPFFAHQNPSFTVTRTHAGWHAKAEWHVLKMITAPFPASKGVFRDGKDTTCSGLSPSPPLQFLLPAWVTAHTSHLAVMAALQVITKQELDCTSMHMCVAALSHLP